MDEIWSLSRRRVLQCFGLLGLGGVVASASAGGASASSTTRTLMAGTNQETTAYINDSGIPGLTAFVVGGIHGDEEAGYLAADSLTDWLPDSGTLVVLPRANTYAIERNQREGPNGDLNRMFDLRAEPTTELARQIWALVAEFDPDLVVDCHESRGRYPDSGLGQSVGFSPARDLRSAAQVAMDHVNATIDGEDDFEPRFLPSPAEYPHGVFVQKTAFEFGIPSYILETYEELDQADRVRWQRNLVRRLVDIRRDIYTGSTPRHTIKILGSGPKTRFAFDVTGEVFATDTQEDSDDVGTSHVEGQVSTLGDYYQYTGRIDSFEVLEGNIADLTIYVDGVEKGLDELTPTTESVLELTTDGPTVEYQFDVDEPFTATSDLDDADWVFDDRAYGTVSSGIDRFRYRRDVEHFAVTEGDPSALSLTVDGEPTTVDVLDEKPSHELHVVGTGPTVRFQFAVSGTVEETDTLESTDEVFDSAVAGRVSTQDDYYRFTGDIHSFTVVEGSADDIDLLVDGVRTSVAELNPSEVHELTVQGTGPTARFEATVSELTYPTAELEDSDAVGVSRIEGQVSTLDDRYLFTGDITGFRMTQGTEDDVRILVDGEERSIAELNGVERTLRVAGTGPEVRFTFTADERVAATDTLESSDEVYDQSVAGKVSTLDDTYRFSSEIISFTVTEGSADDIEVYVDGMRTSISDLNPDRIHDLRVAGTGPTARFVVETSGPTYPTATLEDNDSVGDARIDGQVSTLDDRYLFEGDITRFEMTQGSSEDIEVYVDGERRSIAELNGEEHTLRVAGTGPAVRFTFAADEWVGATDTLESSDEVYDQSVAGKVSTLDDTYRFSSEIISFRVTEGSAADIDVFVDGTETSIAALNPDRIHDLRVAGTGPTARFVVETSGPTYPTATLEDSDSVTETRIDGQVSTLDDRYLFEGDITRFEMTQGSSEDIEVYVDGERRSIAELNG